MRLYLRTTPNTELIPFSYQSKLVGALHKWLGHNKYHDELSLYSLSGLPQVRATSSKGLDYPSGASFFVGSVDQEMLKSVVDGILKDPKIAFGMEVAEINLKLAPSFGSYHKFFVESPVFIQRNIGDQKKFYYYTDPESDQLLTETMTHKLQKAGLGHLKATISFDRSYQGAKTKLATYKGIANKGSLCPVIVAGDPEAVAFAWSVGVGNGTGIGFGAVR